MTHILEDLTYKMVPVNPPQNKEVDRWVLGMNTHVYLKLFISSLRNAFGVEPYQT